jgi:serine/threonine protein kinase
MEISKHCFSLLDNYIILEQIGSGSFGEVYLAQYRDGGYVAVKVENKHRNQRIYNEYKIYMNLHKSNFNIGLPKIYDYLQSAEYNIMVMQLLGPSLEDLFNKYNRIFKLSTVLPLAIQMVSLLEKLHQAGYIHRDIKPNNFLIGRGKNKSQVYIMDFGLSKRYLIKDKHIKFKDKRNLIGTARYASVNMHMGFEPSRRDDLESVGYILVYFLKGLLPWQGLKKQKNVKHFDTIGEKKMCVNLDNLCENLPNCFKKYISYCRKIKFDETPDYSYLKKIFEKAIKKNKIEPKFEWL